MTPGTLQAAAEPVPDLQARWAAGSGAAERNAADAVPLSAPLPAPPPAQDVDAPARLVDGLPLGPTGSAVVLAVLLAVLAVTVFSLGRSRSGMASKAQVKHQLGRRAVQRADRELRPSLAALRDRT